MISFKWSWIYEQMYHASGLAENFDYEKTKEYVDDYLEKIRNQWGKIESNIFDLIEKFSGLKWKNKDITCYIIKRSKKMPISDPLTISIEFEDDEGNIFPLTENRFIDMLIHELIHIFLEQNESETNNYFNNIFELYKDEEFETILHLIVHAIHKKIILNLFDEKRLNTEIEMSGFYPAYKKSWEIVNNKTAEEIINEFRNLF